MKKVLAIMLSLVLTLVIFPVSVFAEDVETEPDYGEVIPLTQEEIDAHLLDESIFDNPTGIGDDLPLSVDHSTSEYFPVIGQQMYGSCVAWSSVYYMYTYEVNRLHGTSAKMTDAAGNIVNNEQNVYSPTWTYSLMASTVSGGIGRSWAFNFSAKHGQLPLAYCPQYNTTTVPFRWIPTNRDAIVSALSTRLSGWNSIKVNTSAAPITSPSSSALNLVKYVLSSGHVLGVDRCKGDISKAASNGEECVYRVSSGGGAHAVTIVGYDDTIWCDINGDGSVQPAEWGAFKIANSSGTSSHNDGYYWISYDALNVNTAVPGDWERPGIGTRQPAFSLDTTEKDNVFMVIYVQDYTVDYAAVATFHVTNPQNLKTYMQRSGAYGDGVPNLIAYGNNDDSNKAATNFDCILAFDFSSLAYPVSYYLSGYTWKMWPEVPNDALITDCVMVDNLNNPIKGYSYSTNSSKWECALNLTFGDLDYSEALSMQDALILFQYVNGNITDFSNLQLVMADMNGDTTVNMLDAAMLYQLTGASGASLDDADLMEQMHALFAQNEII